MSLLDSRWLSDGEENIAATFRETFQDEEQSENLTDEDDNLEANNDGKDHDVDEDNLATEVIHGCNHIRSLKSKNDRSRKGKRDDQKE